MRVFLCLIFAVLLSSCIKPKIVKTTYVVKDKIYLALGDSYTSGEGVNTQESFPYQLVARLNGSGVKTLEPEVIAMTGWTSADLLAGIQARKITKKYDFVTLQIGVNNQFSRLSPVIYRKEFNQLLNIAISHSIGGRATVYVISIPDWSVTPQGRRRKDYHLVPKEIDEFNAINREESLNESVNYIDITPRSRLALTETSLLSIDSLHPSKKFYGEWVDSLFPLVRKELYW